MYVCIELSTSGKGLTALLCLEIWKSQPPGAFGACTGIAKHIFPHYLINGMIFGKKPWNIKCAF